MMSSFKTDKMFPMYRAASLLKINVTDNRFAREEEGSSPAVSQSGHFQMSRLQNNMGREGGM